MTLYSQDAETIALHVHRMFSVYLTLVSLIEKGNGVDEALQSTLNVFSNDKSCEQDYHQMKVILQERQIATAAGKH